MSELDPPYMKEQVRHLWETCFHDSQAFTDLYFRQRYTSENNLAISNGNQVIAALQMLPYPMTFDGGTINTAYISGACTHPDFRNCGVMRELLLQAFACMQCHGVPVSTLIPAEPWLFDYYARYGYAPVFHTYQTTFTSPAASLPAGATQLKATSEFTAETYSFLNRELRKRGNCVQHTETDYRVILADLRLSGGKVYTLHEGNNITALAVAYPMEDGWQINELAADAPQAGKLLLQLICRENNLPSIRLCSPCHEGENKIRLGMARIINATDMLQRHAAAHPHETLNIELADPQLEGNSGYYYLCQGRCIKKAKRQLGCHLALTIGQLAEMLFATPAPYMSLMLD